MGSSMVQGLLWGAAVNDWVELQEPFFVPLWNAMLDSVGIRENLKIFDAGCGAGGLSTLAAAKGAIVTGIDASDAMIAVAKKAVPKGDFRVGDLEELPFAGQGFMAVFAANCLQFCTSPVSAARELRRVCAPRGKVVIGAWGRPQDCDMHEVYESIGAVVPGGNPKDGPFAFSEPEALENLISEAGMFVASTKGVECPMKFPDQETFWRAMFATGPVQRAIQMIADEERVREAVLEGARRYTKPDGSIAMQNRMRYAIAVLNQ